MKFSPTLFPAHLVKRYKRFLADVRLADGTVVTAHVANPGSMIGLCEKGLRVWLEQNDDPKRKLKYSWKLAELSDGTMVCVDTGAANKILADALKAHNISELHYDTFRAEVKYAENSRVDFLLTHDGRDHYLEVKSITLSRQPGLMEFPDSVTKRGTKHMGDLAAMVAEGHDATILYLVCRDDGQVAALAEDIDPVYVASVHKAIDAGVRVLCYDTILTPAGIRLGKTLPLAILGVSG